MPLPDLNALNEVRKTGYRPSVVCCCIFAKKVILVHKKEYALWAFPQSGVRNKETIEMACDRALTEEMGADFTKNCDLTTINMLGDDQVEFLPEKQGKEDLATDDGTAYKMLGKKYYFCAITCSTDQLDITKTQYDDSFWFESKPALFLTKHIHQPGKRRVTMKAITLLKEAGIIE
jgi:ADP-ribose pyrophosphatase YjhB (NUDIX family)